ANRKEEIAITQSMVERVERRFDLRPERLVGDTVYGVARLLKWVGDRKITPPVPGWGSRRATMAPSAGPTSSSTRNVTSIFVRAVQSLPAPAASIRATSSTTEPTSMTAQPAR